MASLKELKKAAEELNDVLGLNPPIDTKADEDDLVEQVKEGIKVIEESDEFSDLTQKVIDELSKPAKKAATKPAKKEPEPEEEEEEEEKPVKKPAKKAPEPEEEEEEEEEKPAKKAATKPVKKAAKEEEEDVVEEFADLIESIEDAEKLSELKEIAKEEDAFKKLRSKLTEFKTKDTLKEAMLDLLKPKKEAKKAGGTKKRGATKERVAFLTPFITEGKYTKKDLLEKVLAEFPEATTSSVQTLLTDGKNPKYNRFPKLLIQEASGIMKFAKEKSK